MKIVIIGSKGFIGSHATDFFSKNHQVWQSDVVVDYTTSNYYQVDATNADYSELFQLQKFDVCINCSGAASVPDSIKNPQRDFVLNTVNVFKQLDAIRKYNSDCKYINLSSAAVYGNPNYLPIDNMHPLQPISPYGKHKKMAEDICGSFYENYNLKTCNLRIFSAYGEGLKKQLFWDLYKKGSNENKVKLFGTGKESRDFIHVKDLVKAIDLVIEKASFLNDTINVSNGNEVLIPDAVSLFYKYFKPEISISFKGEAREGDPNNWVADISKLKSFGYKTTIDLETGLNSYVQWLRENE
ncbi:NAD(P)-dependent oxidoreductase [uncultured Psychroserpens sp.]|uniref:NAD-dependent epimerase/dehydratase family protein n=1 Tax=uncultured Psychroserpens sp. TaxID=255436 RepID=UPI00260F7899|nr:SDR family oxidoreductase [uncultured Psychroserpens sp.]